ncbi:hypothetical protein BW731_03025 [Vagococcus martis]|uniref:DUF3955 domain-containing protein n=1 Tax=Vagococcus martis TaxID=1768210 RepID=A0A1V4DFF4_9ENTE|nr:hypothetical protein BW731_03025 [Vagococcus martis]
MKKYKNSFYCFFIGFILFSITIMWQNSLGPDSKTTDYFFVILFIQIISCLMILLAFFKIIIMKLKEINNRK